MSLQIGVALTGRRVPRWVRGLIDHLRSVPEVDVHPYFASPACATQPAPWLTDRIYNLSRSRFDPFGEVDLAVADQPPTIDLVIWLSPPASVVLPKLGAITIGLGEPTTAPPYWREVLTREPVTSTTLYWHAESLNQARILRVAETATLQGLFFTRNAEEPLVAVTRMITGFLSDPRLPLHLPEQAIAEPQRCYPSSFESGRFLARQAARSVALRMEARGRLPKWFLALRRQPGAPYQEIPVPKDAEMADPFLIADAGRTWLFYEEVPANARRGRLTCMEVLDNGAAFGAPRVVMERDYHLSYPCVLTHGGDHFLLPETGGARNIQLLRATRFPYEWQLETLLMENFAAVDTTPFFLDGRWYFFTSTTAPFIESFLYWSETLGGRWHLHPRSPISSSVKSCRGAGHLYYDHGRLMRPTQDCSIRYGYGMTINEVTRLTPTEFEERPSAYIAPTWTPGLLGTHTINSIPGLEIVDGLRFPA